MTDTPPPRVSGDSTLPGLELLRGLACVAVVFGHLQYLIQDNPRMMLVGWVLGNWAVPAVIAFFVLSGYVIALSQERKHRHFPEFMRARFRRLMPLYLLVVLAAIPVEKAVFPQHPVTGTVIAHLFFLQYPPHYLFKTDGPLWSLSFEFMFYLAYALAIGRWKDRLCQVWLAVALVAFVATVSHHIAPGLAGHFQAILAFSPIWLLGTLLIRRPRWADLGLHRSLVLLGFIPLLATIPTLIPLLEMPAPGPVAGLLMGLIFAPLICHLAGDTRPETARPSVKLWLVVAGLYLVLALFFARTSSWENAHFTNVMSLAYSPLIFLVVGFYRLLLHYRAFLPPTTPTFLVGLGKMSYAVYMIHQLIIEITWHLTSHYVLLALADFVLVLGVAWVMEYRLQPWLCRGFDRLWPRPVLSL